MKKVIFVNQYVTHLFVDIVNDFVRRGIEVTLVTGNIESSQQISKEVKVKRFTKYDRKNFFTRVSSWFFFTIRTIIFLLSKNSDLFISTNPPILPIFLSYYSRFKKISQYVLFYDIYPDVFYSIGILKKTNLFYILWGRLNEKIINQSEVIFTIGDSLGGSLMNYNVNKKPIHIIPNWIDYDLIKPIKKTDNSFLIEHAIQNKFIILYSGNFGLTHDFSPLLQVMKKLKDKDQIQFVFIGDGSEKASFEKDVKHEELSNVLVLPWQESDKLPLIYGSADIGIILLSQGSELVSIPSKTYSYLSAGSAILGIAGKGSELDRLIYDNNVGKIFHLNNIHGIIDFINTVFNNHEILNAYKSNSRKTALNFGIKNSERFYNIIQQNKPIP